MTATYPAGTRLGLLADSHGRAPITRAAVKLLVEKHRADVLLYLGDVCETAVLDALAGHRAHVVFGNCDLDWMDMAEYAESLGLIVDHPCGLIVIGEKRVMFAHGHISSHFRHAVAGGADYFCHGHTHEPRDERIGSLRVLNPGALTRAATYTVAWLDPTADRFEVDVVEAH